MLLYAENTERAQLAVATLAQRRQERAGWLNRLQELVTQISPTPPSWEDLISLLPTPPAIGELAEYHSIPHLVETLAAGQERAIKTRLLALYLEKSGTFFPLADGQHLVDVMSHPEAVTEAYQLILKIDKIEDPVRYMIKDKNGFAFAPPAISDEEKEAIYTRERRYIEHEATRQAIATAEGMAEIINLRAAKQGKQLTPADVPPPFELTLTPYFERDFDKQDPVATHPGGLRNPFLWRVNYEYFFCDHPGRNYLAPDEKDKPSPALPTSTELMKAKRQPRSSVRDLPIGRPVDSTVGTDCRQPGRRGCIHAR